MTTAKKTTEKATIQTTVKAYFSTEQDLSKTASILLDLGVTFSDINKTIQKEGENQGFIVTREKLDSIVYDAVENVSKPMDYYQLLDVANNIKVDNVDFDDLLESVASNFDMKIKPNSFYKRMTKLKGHHGTIGNWLLENPDATCSDLMQSESGDKSYLLEVAGYMQFFKQLESLKVAN